MSMGYSAEQEPSNTTLAMIRNPDGSPPIHLPVNNFFPNRDENFGVVYRLLNMMVFQFLFYTRAASAFQMPLSIVGYLIAIDAHIKKLVNEGNVDEASALGFYGFDMKMLKNTNWQNDQTRISYQEFPEELTELVECFSGQHQLGIFKTQPLQSHAINATFLRFEGRVFVPTLTLLNLLLSIDSRYRYKNKKSLCLGEWHPNTIEATDIVQGLRKRKKRLIYFEPREVTLHGNVITPVEAYGHDLTHVIQLHRLYNLYPIQTKIM